jgi:hypothetical protein
MTSPPLFPNARGQPGFVLTVSVGLVWVLRNRTPTTYPYDVVGSLIRTAAIVPESWMVDLAEAVVEAERQGLITPAQATAHLAVLAATRSSLTTKHTPWLGVTFWLLPASMVSPCATARTSNSLSA